MLQINSKYKTKVQKGVAFDRKGVPSTKLRFADKDMDGNWQNMTFVTDGSYPCEKEDGFEFIAREITGIYVYKSNGYTNINVYGKADVYDRNGRLIGSVNKQAEEDFKAVTGNIEDLPF